MENRLFFIENGMAKEMEKARYEKEADLQKIVADNPNLLTRDWDLEGERKLFLVKQEQKSQAQEDGGNAFSLDHLLVDSEGIPVLVEVKRSTDTRIRREVAAQMLDYACRASAWTADGLKEQFEENNKDLEHAQDEKLWTDEFWENVAANLKAERMRLVFVADEIPETLRVLIEFMDRAMKDIEVYGVELKPYRNGNTELLSKRIVGNSFVSNPKPATTKYSQEWTEESYKQKMLELGLSDVLAVYEELDRFITEDLHLSCSYGKGAVSPSHIIKCDGTTLYFVYITESKGRGAVCDIQICVSDLAKRIGDTTITEQLQERICSIPHGADAVENGLIWGKEVLHVDLRVLKDPADLEEFKTVIRMLVARIRNP